MERDGGAAVGDSARNLVGEDEPEPDSELEEKVAPTTRKDLLALGGGVAGSHSLILFRDPAFTVKMTDFSVQAIEQSGYLRAGFADHYDAYRPSPPAVLLEALARYAGGPPLRRVVDLGSGTGLSARAWSSRADEVVGVEPNPKMLAVARAQTAEPSVRFVEAFAADTGLEDGAADLVTCSQSFHWMDRAATLAEADRLLRPGGVFAAYDYDMPPLVHPEVDAAFAEHLTAAAAVPGRAPGRGRLDSDAEAHAPRRDPGKRPLRVRRGRRSSTTRRRWTPTGSSVWPGVSALCPS